MNDPETYLHGEIDDLKDQLAEAKAEIEVAYAKNGVSQRAWLAEKAEKEALQARLDRAVEALKDFGAHDGDCILSQWSAGENTPDGGYRMKFAGKWYQASPIDETPKCNCGLDEILASLSPAHSAKPAEGAHER